MSIYIVGIIILFYASNKYNVKTIHNLYIYIYIYIYIGYELF